MANGTTPSGRSVTVSDIVLLADDAGRFGRDMNRAQVLEGRLPQAPDELALTFLAADHLGVGLGDVLQLQMAGPVGVSSGEASAMESFRVVGVVAMEGGFPPLTPVCRPWHCCRRPTRGPTRIPSRPSPSASAAAGPRSRASSRSSTVWPAASRWWRPMRSS